MAAPYSHSLPQLTQEPVSSTSVNSADYSKMMRKARRLCTVSTDARQFCCHLPPRLTAVCPGSSFRTQTALPSPGGRQPRGLVRSAGLRSPPRGWGPRAGTLRAAAAKVSAGDTGGCTGGGAAGELRQSRGPETPAVPRGTRCLEGSKASAASCSASGNLGAPRGLRAAPPTAGWAGAGPTGPEGEIRS